MTTPIKVVAITDGGIMRSPRMREFIARCYADPKFDTDPDELCEFLAVELECKPPPVKLFVAVDETRGPCGMSLAVLVTNVLSPYPWINHFVAECPEARDPLVEATLGCFRSLGFKKLSVYNATGASDDVHRRLYRKFAKGTVRGSHIVYEMEN